MKPLTHEELNRIEKVGMVTQFMPFSDEKMEWRTIEKKALDALIAAARHSIPRPIAEAPSNCESIVRVDTCFLCDGIATNIDTWYIAYKDGSAWYTRSGHEIYPTEFISIPEPTNG
jgi:hypothetical protein